jgi:hypothetical protein
MRRIIISIILSANCIAALPQTSISSLVLDYYGKIPQEKIYVHTDKSTYIPGDTIWFRAHMVDAATNMPVSRSKFMYIELIGTQGDKPVDIAMIKADADGVFANMIALPIDIQPGKYTLAAFTQWMRNFGLDKFCYKQIDIVDSKHIPSGGQAQRNISSISLAVLPEGGHLISGKQQRLAFKAIGDDGKGVDVDVQVVDSGGNSLAKGKSQHLGMGYLDITVQEEQILDMIASTSNGLICRTRIPKALKTGVAIHVTQRGGSLFVKPIVSDDIDSSKFTILIYGAGNLYEQELDGIKNKVLRIPTSTMKEGVVNIALLDSNNNILSERMCFIRHP